jgi:hypothetical protein
LTIALRHDVHYPKDVRKAFDGVSFDNLRKIDVGMGAGEFTNRLLADSLAKFKELRK